MTKDEALRLALEALERYVNEDEVIEGMRGNEPWVETKRIGEKAITAIKAALEAKYEPVAQGSIQHFKIMMEESAWEGRIELFDVLANIDEFYTTPPQRTWVGLTDEEREQHRDDWRSNIHDKEFRAIEAKLKEKNT